MIYNNQITDIYQQSTTELKITYRFKENDRQIQRRNVDLVQIIRKFNTSRLIAHYSLPTFKAYISIFIYFSAYRQSY